MPKFFLTRYEVETPDLPKVCIHCGEPATTVLDRKVNWMPPRALLMFTLFNIFGWLFARKMIQRVRIKLPLCPWHGQTYRWDTAATITTIGLFFAAVILVAFTGLAIHFYQICIGFLILMMVFGLLNRVLTSRRLLRIVRVIGDSIEFTALNDRFIEAVEKQRKLREENPRNRYYDDLDE
jgi:hypothetical protein